MSKIKMVARLKHLEVLKNKRGHLNDWYVLRFDMKTTDYNNNIVFQNYQDAFEKFKGFEPRYKEERIELIFAPTEDDKTYKDNELIIVKYHDDVNV